jgi:hypothetical protein
MKTSNKSKQVPTKAAKVAQQPARSESPAAIDNRLPLKKQRIHAGRCPRSEHHTSTRVYRIVGSKQYCICDDCGHAWVRPTPEADA